MALEFTYDELDNQLVCSFVAFLCHTFPNPVNPLLGENESDRIIELFESLEPFARITPTPNSGGEILLFFVDEGDDGELWMWCEGSGILKWNSLEEISQEEIVDSLKKILT